MARVCRFLNTKPIVQFFLSREVERSAPAKDLAEEAPSVHDAAGAEPAAASAERHTFPTKALGRKAVRMLQFAAEGEKSIDEFFAFAHENSIAQDRQRVRAMLHQYKSAYGLLDSPVAGRFRLSTLGADYLASVKPINQPEELGGATNSEY